LYSRLACLPTAFISIGHRPSLRKFHNRVIELPLAFEPAIETDGRATNELPISPRALKN
jgi:ABC-type uncharacterized transport system fused permease/ATPase subunit